MIFAQLLCFENDPFHGVHVPLQLRAGEGTRLLVDVVLCFQPLQQWLEKLFRLVGSSADAIVISFAAFGKSPVFDEIRASARWLIQ